ncbi:MAG: enoyl-CoA hydratase/isomerase family protein [Microbacteriaceae bacterium]|nr:MAG: enoyl-CoA hydratase/isomerase family protein [Microbacteriaceae bacterium]
MNASATDDVPEELRYRVEGHIAHLELNRPAKLNTMTPAMGKSLLRIVDEINADDAVRVVIFAGVGPKAFSAGSDIKVLDEYGTSWQLRNRVDYARAIWAIRKPVIAKIRGYCIGGGLEMALMSDIRYASTTALFGAGEIKLGWHGGAGNTQLLPRIVPLGRAAEILFTGDMVASDEALAIGLADRVFADDDLDAAVEELATRVCASAPLAVQMSKHLVRVAMSTSLDVGLAYENDTFTYLLGTSDAAEGRSAFAEKRRPRFEGT